MRSVAQPHMPTSSFTPAAPDRSSPPLPAVPMGPISGWDRGLLRLRRAGHVPGQSPPNISMVLHLRAKPLPSSRRRWFRHRCQSRRRLRCEACASRAGRSGVPMPSLSPLHRPHSTGRSRGPCLQRGGGGIRGPCHPPGGSAIPALTPTPWAATCALPLGNSAPCPACPWESRRSGNCIAAGIASQRVSHRSGNCIAVGIASQRDP